MRFAGIRKTRPRSITIFALKKTGATRSKRRQEFLPLPYAAGLSDRDQPAVHRRLHGAQLSCYGADFLVSLLLPLANVINSVRLLLRQQLKLLILLLHFLKQLLILSRRPAISSSILLVAQVVLIWYSTSDTNCYDCGVVLLQISRQLTRSHQQITEVHGQRKTSFGSTATLAIEHQQGTAYIGQGVKVLEHIGEGNIKQRQGTQHQLSGVVPLQYTTTEMVSLLQ